MGFSGIIGKILGRLLVMVVIAIVTPIILYIFPQIYKLFLTRTFVIPPQIIEMNTTAVASRQFYITEGSSTLFAMHLVKRDLVTAEDQYEKLLEGYKHKIVLYLWSEHRDPIEKFTKFASVLLKDEKTQIVTFQHKGFGNSAGDTTNSSAVEDTRTVYNWLRKRAPESEIHLWGHGIGGSIAAAAVLSIVEEDKQDVKSLVLEAPYSNASSVLERRFDPHIVYGRILRRKWLPVQLIVNSLHNIFLWFDTANLVARLDLPTLILNSEADEDGQPHLSTRDLVKFARKFHNFLFHIEWRCKKVQHHPGFEANATELERIIKGFDHATKFFWTPEKVDG